MNGQNLNYFLYTWMPVSRDTQYTSIRRVISEVRPILTMKPESDLVLGACWLSGKWQGHRFELNTSHHIHCMDLGQVLHS